MTEYSQTHHRGPDIEILKHSLLGLELLILCSQWNDYADIWLYVYVL